MRPSIQAGNIPDPSIKYFSTLLKLCGLVAKAMLPSLFLFVASLWPSAPPIATPIPHYPLFHCPLRHLPSPTLIHHPCLLRPLLFAGDGDDNRPGMRGGHQMVIDVQTGETHAASVMTWLFNRHYDSYPPTQTQNAKLYYCLIKLTLPPCPLQTFSSKRKQSWGHFSSKST